MGNQAFILERDKQVFVFEGKKYNKDEVLELSKNYLENEKNGEHTSLFEFLMSWFDDNETVEVRSSGSTGTAKIMQIEKNRMMQSACFTCEFFNLFYPQKTLLCMPLEFIGAKMLVVRALVAGLDLYNIPPTLHPFKDILNNSNIPHSYDFIPMTPQQAWNSLQTKEEEELFKQTKNILLGGMAVGADLKDKIMNFPNAIWSSYGMTETLSHIAVRKVNGEDASEYFTPFKNVRIELLKKDTLNIFAPAVNPDILHTSDRAEILDNGTFRILGRADNCINSGGVKIQIEEVEEALSKFLETHTNFQITSMSCSELGEKLVLLLEKEYPNIQEKIKNLPKYWKPKEIFVIDSLPITDSGKPNRHEAKEIAKNLKK